MDKDETVGSRRAGTPLPQPPEMICDAGRDMGAVCCRRPVRTLDEQSVAVQPSVSSHLRHRRWPRPSYCPFGQALPEGSTDRARLGYAAPYKAVDRSNVQRCGWFSLRCWTPRGGGLPNPGVACCVARRRRHDHLISCLVRVSVRHPARASRSILRLTGDFGRFGRGTRPRRPASGPAVRLGAATRPIGCDGGGAEVDACANVAPRPASAVTTSPRRSKGDHMVGGAGFSASCGRWARRRCNSDAEARDDGSAGPLRTA